MTVYEEGFNKGVVYKTESSYSEIMVMCYSNSNCSGQGHPISSFRRKASKMAKTLSVQTDIFQSCDGVGFT